MSKKKDKEVQAEAVGVTRTFFLPTLGVSVEASSAEEALRLANEQKEEGGDAEL